MREIRTSGLMSGIWKRDYRSPRQISTLPAKLGRRPFKPQTALLHWSRAVGPDDIRRRRTEHGRGRASKEEYSGTETKRGVSHVGVPPFGGIGRSIRSGTQLENTSRITMPGGRMNRLSRTILLKAKRSSNISKYNVPVDSAPQRISR